MITETQLQSAAHTAWSAMSDEWNAKPGDRDTLRRIHALHAIAFGPDVCELIVSALEIAAANEDAARRSRNYEAETVLLEILANGWEIRRKPVLPENDIMGLRYQLRNPAIAWVSGPWRGFVQRGYRKGGARKGEVCWTAEAFSHEGKKLREVCDTPEQGLAALKRFALKLHPAEA